jgi:hypothetical protein
MRTAIYIICSPRPRVGKTLLARLLTEYLLARHRDVVAFDLSATEPSLLDYLPKVTETAQINDTFGQMQLMDRLIVNDGVPKVLDLGATAFESFFQMFEQIGFVKEANYQGIDPIALFILDNGAASSRGYRTLQRNFPPEAFICINNEAVLFGEVPDWAQLRRTVEVKMLPEFLKGYIGKTSFSFAAFASNKTNSSSELYDWIRSAFLHFREIELGLMLKPD